MATPKLQAKTTMLQVEGRCQRSSAAWSFLDQCGRPARSLEDSETVHAGQSTARLSERSDNLCQGL